MNDAIFDFRFSICDLSTATRRKSRRDHDCGQFARFLSGAVTFTFALGSALLVGCATPRSSEQAAVLALPYEQFDQTFGSGWRTLFDQREYAGAARLIEYYLQSHQELTFGQKKFLHLHAGMMFALEGSTTRAVKHLDQAKTAGVTAGPWPDWNDFISANRAFLMHDRMSLQAARDRLATAHSPRIAPVDRLLQTFGGSYADWYFWARISPKVSVARDTSPQLRAGAEKLAKAFGAEFSVSDDGLQPSCVWVEVRDFAPKSSAMGYVVIHSPDGTHIIASNQYWLDAAVERFIKSSRMKSGVHEAPFGLTTSFNLAITPQIKALQPSLAVPGH
jgi:hypothetical protein